MKIGMRHFLIIAAVVAIFAAGPVFAADGGYTKDQIHGLLYKFMNFAAFLIILLYFVRKPVIKFFHDRREHIARTLEYLETQARNLEEQTEIANRQIAEIAAERESIIAQYERLGQKEADRIIEEAKVTAEAMVRKTQAAMEQEVSTARQILLLEIVDLATKAATEIIKTNITAEDQNRLANEFIAKVEKLQAGKQ